MARVCIADPYRGSARVGYAKIAGPHRAAIEQRREGRDQPMVLAIGSV